MKKVVLFFGVVLFCLISFPKVGLAHSSVQIIEMTSSGFSPDPIKVDENSTIIFVNKDTKDRWPASNVHPTHDQYPDFDPKKPIKPNESWTFKPKKVGVWRYHDHLSPHMRGMITVKAEIGKQVANEAIERKNIFDFLIDWKNSILSFFNRFKISPKSIKLPEKAEFSKLSEDQQFKTMDEISLSLGGKKVWEFIKTTYASDSGASGNIHDLAHQAGSLIYQRGGFAGLGNCSNEFAFGCYHGFLDKAFAKDLDQLEEAYDACSKLGPTNSGPVASCVHGIGHGVASFYSVKDLKGALGACRKLINGNVYCFDGVFMEFARSAPDDFYKLDDPLYPCNQLEKEFAYIYSFACGRNQPALLMSRFKMGFDQVIATCQEAESDPFKKACFDSLGFSLAATNNVGQIISGCKKLGSDEADFECLKSAAGELIFQELPDWDKNSQIICQSARERENECGIHIQRLISEYKRVK